MDLYKHCCLDSDLRGIVDANEDIAEFRERVIESIKDVTFIIGSLELLKNVGLELNNL